MNKEQEVLKPCPFCGGTNIALLNGGLGNRFVHCDDCRATTDDGSEERAIAAWNRRSSDEQAEVVAWQWQQCKSLQPGVWPEQWNNIELRPGGDRTQYWRDLAARIPDEVRVRPLYASPPAVAAGGVTVTREMAEDARDLLRLYARTPAWANLANRFEAALNAIPTPPSRGEGV